MTVSRDGAVISRRTRADERVTRFGALLPAIPWDETAQSSTCSRGGPGGHERSVRVRTRVLTTNVSQAYQGYMIRHKGPAPDYRWHRSNGLPWRDDTLDRMENRIVGTISRYLPPGRSAGPVDRAQAALGRIHDRNAY